MYSITGAGVAKVTVGAGATFSITGAGFSYVAAGAGSAVQVTADAGATYSITGEGVTHSITGTGVTEGTRTMEEMESKGTELSHQKSERSAQCIQRQQVIQVLAQCRPQMPVQVQLHRERPPGQTTREEELTSNS